LIVALSNACQASNALFRIALADATPLDVALVRTGIARKIFNVGVTALLAVE
jgi:hypothetical protein